MPTKRRRRLMESISQKRARRTRRIGNGVAEYYRVILRAGSVPGRQEDGIVLPAIIGAAVAMIAILALDRYIGLDIDWRGIDGRLMTGIFGAGMFALLWLSFYFIITPSQYLRYPEGWRAILRSISVYVLCATLVPLVLMLVLTALLALVDVALIRNLEPQFRRGSPIFVFEDEFLILSALSLPASLAAAVTLFLTARKQPPV